MASAMRKMAVYLGLVEDDHRFGDKDDHRFGDKYDSYGEYEDYDDQADRPEVPEEVDVRPGRDDYAGHQAADWRAEHAPQTAWCRKRLMCAPAGTTTPVTRPPTGAPSTRLRRPIWRVLRHCILAPTMKRVLLVNTSAKALR